MKTVAGVAALIALVVLQWALIINFSPKERPVDCGMVSFHPDYTQGMRDACRKHIKE